VRQQLHVIRHGGGDHRTARKSDHDTGAEFQGRGGGCGAGDDHERVVSGFGRPRSVVAGEFECARFGAHVIASK